MEKLESTGGEVRLERPVRLRCPCGAEFERPKAYAEPPRKDVLWQWKMQFCDQCVDAKVDKALGSVMPTVIKALAT
jgi:hypothetical protein